MGQLILFILLGVGPGALIAALALSVVITYRGSGTINFAAGAMATLGAYLFYGLRTGGYLFFSGLKFASSLPTAPAFLISVAVCCLLGLALDLLVYQRLRASPPLAKLIASVGVLLLIQAVVILRFGGNGQSAPSILQGGVVNVFGGPVPDSRLVLLGLVAAVTVIVAAVYRYTSFGLATRAAQEDEVEATYTGLSPGTLSALNALLAAAVAAALGILVAPLTSLDPTTLILAAVPAMGAALFARFTSFGVAAVVGLAMGMLESVITLLQTDSWFPTSGGLPLPGVSDVVFLILIGIALVWRGSRLPQRGALVEPRLPPAPPPRLILRPFVVLTVAAALMLMFLPFGFRQAMINTLIGGIACLSLVVVTGYLGQVSLLPYALGGIAGLVVSKLGTDAHLGFPAAPILGILAATLLGVLSALPALRVRGIQLAILTVAAAVAIQSFVLNNTSAGGGINGAPVSSPSFLGLSLGPSAPFPTGDGQLPSPIFGLLCLICFAVLCVLVSLLRRSALGHQLLAIRSSERAASAIGLSPAQLKLVGFGISSAIAAVAGILLAYNYGSVDVANFDLVNALGLVAFAYMGGITTVRGSIIGGLLVTEGLLGHYLQVWLHVSPSYYQLLAGVGLLVTVVLNPNGIALNKPPSFLRRRRRRVPGVQPAAAPTARTVEQVTL